MFEGVSVLIPTRGRLSRLQTLIASFEETTDGRAEIVFRVDDDDRGTLEFLTGLRYRLVVGPRLDGYRSLPLFFNEAARAAQGDVLICGNDDMVFRTHGWPTLILEEANKYPDGVFDIGVSTLNEDHYPWCIVSKRIVDVLGFVWDPSIFWGDIFLRDVMSALGRTVKLPSVKIEHDWAGFAPDQVFFESDKSISADYWGATHALAVQKAVARLQPLVGAAV